MVLSWFRRPASSRPEPETVVIPSPEDVILKAFPSFAPNSAGSRQARGEITARTIRRIIPLLQDFAETATGGLQPVLDIAEFCKTPEDAEAADALKEMLDRHGSDKATVNNYHHLYGPILRDRDAVGKILEIGLGTNNTDIVSNMGENGRPGASLRAFRDFCPSAMIFGADIDRRILFAEERIETHFVDQTDTASLDDLSAKLPGDFDLIVDDGLHAPDANLATLRFAMAKLRIGGWAIIEDINPGQTAFWQLVAALVPPNFEKFLIKSRHSMLFAVRRLR